MFALSHDLVGIPCAVFGHMSRLSAAKKWKRSQASRTVDKGPNAYQLQSIHIDWPILPHAGKILIIVDSGS